jgi:hypothetical protein
MREVARKEPLKYVRLFRAELGDRSGPLGMIAALGDMARTRNAVTDHSP